MISTRIILQLEGAFALAICIWAYAANGGSWMMFFLLFLAPDGPLALAAIALSLRKAAIFSVGIIWLAHISFDRMLGFGLKYPAGFRDTHLSPERL